VILNCLDRIVERRYAVKIQVVFVKEDAFARDVEA
jgi:hypothetical protein